MKTVWGQQRLGDAARRSAVARAFTLIDVLVSIAVIGVLIAILLPSISRVRESAQRVVCGSNLRQIGLAVHMYAESSHDFLPDSVFLDDRFGRGDGEGSSASMDIVRTQADPSAGRVTGDWDGLGLLFKYDYLAASKVFYCPSHKGNHGFERYEESWTEREGEIVANYQFRGTGPDGRRRLMRIQSSAAIVSDMLRSFEDLNHDRGFNVLQAGLSVAWVEDTGDEISSILQRQSGDTGVDQNGIVRDLWVRLDRPDDQPKD